jgi:hypothetical protein
MESKKAPKLFFPALAVAAVIVIGFAIWSFRSDKLPGPKKHEIIFYIDGTWINKNGYTVTINSKEHIYRGAALGETFDQDYQLKSFHDNIIVFESNGRRIVAQFNSENEMTLTKESGVPIIVTRLKTAGH